MSQHQKQPYDATLKALLNHQIEEMLPYILPGAQFLGELNSEVLKPQPPLRTDKLYQMLYRGAVHILHIEVETKGKSSMPYRMLCYYGILLEQYRKPILSVIIYLFPAPIVESPLEVMSGQELQLLYRYKSLCLWDQDAQQYLDQQAVCMYPLLPTMQGANMDLLIQAIDGLKKRYKGSELSHRLLWLRTLLGRAEAIPEDDKKIVEKEINMFDELLDEDPYLQELVELRVEQRIKQRIEQQTALVAQQAAKEAELQTLQTMLLELINSNFPNLEAFAQSKVTQITKPEVLRVLTVQLYKVSNEEDARTILKVTAA